MSFFTKKTSIFESKEEKEKNLFGIIFMYHFTKERSHLNVEFEKRNLQTHIVSIHKGRKLFECRIYESDF